MSLVGTRIQRITITGVLGKGGMGEVYVGYDEKLAREVALKRIRSEQALRSPEGKARFLREARILSQLQHPGICSIYDFIEHEGDEFLVLELVKGSTLKKVLAEGAQAKRRMQIAQSIVSVLEVAHAEGVVHRDLKPDNVMLSDEGEVKVLDFGVARVVDAEESPQRRIVTSEHTALGDEEPASDSTQTKAGMVVGTIRYMSPEQARGEPVTTASDMYSFGLILEELFAPVQEPDPPSTAPDEADEIATVMMERERTVAARKQGAGGGEQGTGEVPAPPTLAGVARGERQSVAGIKDKDLAKLIAELKSFAPAKRPSAADTLARLRWISERPKRRLRNALVAAVVLTAIAGGVLYTIGLGRERRAAIEARNQAEDLVSFMLQDLSDGLEPIGRLELLDQVADQAIAYYEAVPAQDLVGDTLFRRGLAFWRVAEVQRFQNDLTAALAAMQQARQIHEDVLAEQPENPRWVDQLGIDHRKIGEIHLQRGEFEQAEAAINEAIAIHQRLVAEHPGEWRWQASLAGHHSARGDLYRDQGQAEPALASYEESRRINRRLVQDLPDDAELLGRLAQDHADIGYIEWASGGLPAALASFESAKAMTERLLQDDPTSAYGRNTLVNVTSLIGKVHQAQGNYDLAVSAFERALALHGRLAAEDPTDSRWQGALAWDWGSLSEVQALRGDLPAARSARRSAREILRQLVANDPTNADWRSEFSWESLQLGNLAAQAGDVAAARAAWREAAEAVEAIGDEARPDALAIQVQVLLRLERADDAKPLVDRLLQLGWDDPEFLDLVREAGLAP